MTPPRANDPVRNQLRLWQSLGFAFLEEAPDTGTQEPEPAESAPREFVGPAIDLAIEATPAMPLEERVEALSRVAEEVSRCQACRLCHSRTNTVPGEGDPMAELMFIGEGPGANEDRLGRPFVGEAGALLDKIIVAMQFTRESVFIANVVKCRPPHNRQPEMDEMEACLAYLHRQVDAIRPKAIVLLGKTALMGMIPKHRKSSMGSVRGTWLDFDGIPTMPTYHPAFLLRDPSAKKLVWDDMKKVMAFFGKTAPEKK